MLSAEQKVRVIDLLGYTDHIDAMQVTARYNEEAGYSIDVDRLDWHLVSDYLNHLCNIGILSEDHSKKSIDGFVVYKIG